MAGVSCDVTVGKNSYAASAFKIERDVQLFGLPIFPPDVGARKRESYRYDFYVCVIELWV